MDHAVKIIQEIQDSLSLVHQQIGRIEYNNDQALKIAFQDRISPQEKIMLQENLLNIQDIINQLRGAQRTKEIRNE